MSQHVQSETLSFFFFFEASAARRVNSASSASRFGGGKGFSGGTWAVLREKEGNRRLGFHPTVSIRHSPGLNPGANELRDAERKEGKTRGLLTVPPRRTLGSWK